MMHLTITKGDFVFAEWEAEAWTAFNRKVNELRASSYKKIDQEHDDQNYYEYYRKKGKKKVVTITMMCV